jgi:large subunit ribosomal protein L30
MPKKMPKKESGGKTLRVTLVRSAIGYTKDQKATVRALGLYRMHQTVEHKDNPALRGMIQKIIHLVQMEE